MRQLEEENAKLKRLVADLSLDKAMLQDVLSKKALKPRRQDARPADWRSNEVVCELSGSLYLPSRNAERLAPTGLVKLRGDSLHAGPFERPGKGAIRTFNFPHGHL